MRTHPAAPRMPHWANRYFDCLVQESEPSKQPLPSRLARALSAIVEIFVFAPCVFALTAIALKESFEEWLERADWRRIDRHLTFAGKWMLILFSLYFVFCLAEMVLRHGADF